MLPAIISTVSMAAAPLSEKYSLNVPLIVPSALAPLSPMM
jgi:hypothetical protein